MNKDTINLMSMYGLLAYFTSSGAYLIKSGPLFVGLPQVALALLMAMSISDYKDNM